MPLDGILLLLTVAGGLGTGFWFYYRRTRILRQRLAEANQELERLQRTFNQFAPPRVVEELLERRAGDLAETRTVTILFADLRGFTALSEELEAPELVNVLNTYFQRVNRVVDEQGGFVSKFLGDGLLVLFGALHHNPWQATDAVKAARQMHGEVQALSRSLDISLSLSVGVHRGPVVAGIVGSFAVKEFTVVSHHVNLASRVEQLTRVHDVDLLITESVKAHLDPSIPTQKMPARHVKGMKEPVVTYAVPPTESSSPPDREPLSE